MVPDDCFPPSPLHVRCRHCQTWTPAPKALDPARLGRTPCVVCGHRGLDLLRVQGETCALVARACEACGALLDADTLTLRPDAGRCASCPAETRLERRLPRSLAALRRASFPRERRPRVRWDLAA